MYWNVYGGSVDITILHVPECPNLDVARARVREALDALGLTGAVREIEVTSAAAAARLGMAGSPTVLLDGRDPFGCNQVPSVACRLYRNGTSIEGAPSVAALLEVLAP